MRKNSDPSIAALDHFEAVENAYLDQRRPTEEQFERLIDASRAAAVAIPTSHAGAIAKLTRLGREFEAMPGTIDDGPWRLGALADLRTAIAALSTSRRPPEGHRSSRPRVACSHRAAGRRSP